MTSTHKILHLFDSILYKTFFFLHCFKILNILILFKKKRYDIENVQSMYLLIPIFPIIILNAYKCVSCDAISVSLTVICV